MDRVILTADEAISLLNDGPTVHSFAGGGAILIGADHDRDSVIADFRSAFQIELAGGMACSMKHPLAVWRDKRSCLFFEADMEKVAALEAARAEATAGK